MLTISKGINNFKLSKITCRMGKLSIVKEPIKGKSVMIDINANDERNRTVNDLRVFFTIL